MNHPGLHPGFAVHPVPGPQGGGGGGGAGDELSGQEHGGQVRVLRPDDGECNDDVTETWTSPL